jgi:hypothetical protein
MKCALCRAKKGKRGCKVTSAQLICPSCCASTRRDECVGCDFYETSLAFQREKQIRNKAFAAEIIPDVDDRCDEALKNPNGNEEVTHRSPKQIMDEIAALDVQSAKVLAKIRGLV